MGTIQDRLLWAASKAKSKFSNFMLQTQVLRVEVPLSSTNNNYKLSLKQGSGVNPNGVSGEEVYLDQNDAFAMLAASVSIKKVNPSSTPNQYGNFQLFTYPDPQVFVGAPANRAIEYSALLNIWNGQFAFRTNTLQRIKSMDMSTFLFVPPTQVINAQAAITDVAIGNGLTNQRLAEYGGWDWESKGFVEMAPYKIIDGSEQNQFEITLSQGDILAIDGSYAADGDQDAATRNYLVLRLLGILIPDGSKSAKQFGDSWAVEG